MIFGRMSRLIGELTPLHAGLASVGSVACFNKPKPHKWPARHGTVEFDRAIFVCKPLGRSRPNRPGERIDAITNPARTIVSRGRIAAVFARKIPSSSPTSAIVLPYLMPIAKL
jgi:hypothetical protein